jgi:hypothetical protein
MTAFECFVLAGLYGLSHDIIAAARTVSGKPRDESGVVNLVPFGFFIAGCVKTVWL